MSFNEETLYSNNNETVNSKQIALLKKHFPQCFDKYGKFIQEKILELVNENSIDLSKESYSLNWLGKSYARLLTNLPPETLLTEDKTHNKLEENKNSKNILIKGDNLEVLKHLVNAYSEKVKMIYIDPPYNTGGDGFVYNDDRKFTKEQLSELAAIDSDEAERILEFTTSNSNSHSAWLTFIYPRLYIAKELLKDDGVIYISIDDNEASQLKLICNEVFGESNFLGSIIWKKKTNGNNVGYIPPVPDYILAYGKLKLEEAILGESLTQEFIEQTYKNSDQDPRGPWTTRDLSANHEGPHFPIINEKTNMIYFPPEGRYWVFNEAEVQKRISEGRIIFGKTGDSAPVQKIYLHERTSNRKKSDSWWDKHGYNSDGTKEISELLAPKIFEHSKPSQLISSLIDITVDSKDIVLDFFAGSGTTAHSVFLSNTKDLVTRNFITVQIAESTDRKKGAYQAGYTTIFDITKARITKAAQKIKVENPEYQGDLGFKIFETVDDFRRDNTALTLENLSFFDDGVLTEDQYQALLTTWSLYDGNLLGDNIIVVELADYNAHYCNGRLYFIAPHFSIDALKAFLDKIDNDVSFAPHKVVLYGNNFDSAKQRELSEALRSYANKKSLDLDLVVRN